MKPNNKKEAMDMLKEVSDEIKEFKKRFAKKKSRDLTVLKRIIEQGDGKIHVKRIHVGFNFVSNGFYRRSYESVCFNLIKKKAYLHGYLLAKRQSEQKEMEI